MSGGDRPHPSENARNDLDPRRLRHRPSHFASFAPYEVPTLSSVRRIGLMGDLHGDLEHALQAFRIFADRDVHCILQLGDWGVIWPGRNWHIDLHKFSRALSRHKAVFLFVAGNHDHYPKLEEYPIDADGIRWITSNVGNLPRGYRTNLGSGVTLAALGGANSIDRRLRKEGVSWWAEEQISEADLRRLGSEHVDILIGHEAPLMDEPALDRRAEELGFSPEDAAYAAASRIMFRQAVLQTRPRLTLGGHYHAFYDQLLTLPGEATQQTRVVVLDMNGRGRINLAILDTSTLELEFLYRNGAPAEPHPTAPERTDNGRS